ncbi:protein efr3 [Acrodontium crateriforme]|uniref:Protein efr3 n=1 Tax=Acrodontium crateriforme TaxID=150365 RepID=A0AAQ3M1P2_9PEZI|nr:protein efr3 [Acrodontium crateriforme]
MVKTHLPAHMDSVREKCRPKHQLLILKCYPRLPKNSSADVRPNGSELSYLLYYASTRSSKLQKVGAFLEKKTTADVARFQSARVMVTLQILQALVEKVVGVGSALALITPSVLRVIREVLLHTTDISLIEATLPTWEVFCRHRDYAAFSADQEYRALYEQVVGIYADLAQKNGVKKLGKLTQSVATHDAIRLRDVGLDAIKSILFSATLAFESNGQLLDVLVPAILTNLYSEDGQYLDHLIHLSRKNDEEEKDKVNNRRISIATVRTQSGNIEKSIDADPRAAEGTVQDADELAEEETALLALDCFKMLFSTENRSQIRAGTSAMLVFLSDQISRQRPHSAEKQVPVVAPDSWAEKLFETSTEWTPVQDRFVVLVTLVEALIRLPLAEADLRHHLLYTGLIDHILRSDLNLIGLSVMDVLLGLVQQTLHVLQLNGSTTATTPQSRGRSQDEGLNHTASSNSQSDQMSVSRLRLIVRLKDCIADLAHHVYYTDQITDMISAILWRLKPNPSQSGQTSPLATAAAIEEPKAVAREASTASLQSRGDRSTTSNVFFSFEVARQMALEAVKDIIKVANSSRSVSEGGVADSRNPIPISIWEGTQWLLRDSSSGVRRAYVNAITTWMELETKKSDARLSEPKASPKKTQAQDGVNDKLARRAVSKASAKGRPEKTDNSATSTFMQLLHLACYENALQFAPSSEGDIVVLHLLLATSIRKLGVNTLKDGLPMILALQEEIAKVDLPIAKLRLGGLVHGYLWTIVDVFDFPTDAVGQAILSEITRRKQHKIWVTDISYPPMPLSRIPTASNDNSLDASFVAQEELKPFDHRQALVEKIVEAYEVKILSPMPSAPSSPGRSFALPRTTTGTDRKRASSFLAAQTPDNRLSEAVSPSYLADRTIATLLKEGLMESWSRDSCLANVALAAPKSVSLSGSRSSPTQATATGNHRALLTATSAGTSPRNSSPSSVFKSGQAASYRQQAFGSMNPRLHSESPNRRPSASTNGRNGSSSTDGKATLRIDELKRILANGGTQGGFTTGMVARHDPADDTASDSMVETESADFASEDGNYETHTGRINGATDDPARPPPNIDATHQRPGTMSGPRDAKKIPTTKKDLSALLAGITIEKDLGVAGAIGMVRPPY